MKTQDNYREFCRRQHGAMAAFLMFKCWTEGSDFVVLTREFLEQYLGLKRFKDQRKMWLQEDFEALFPHQNDLVFNKSQGKFASYYFSRKPFFEGMFDGAMFDKERLSIAKRNGLAGSIVDSHKINERQIMTRLALLASRLSKRKMK